MHTNPKLLVILAHPDDESFPIGGTLARYAAAGVEVVLISATRGEAGILGLSRAKTAVIREQELRNAAKVLGLSAVRFLGYEDGQLSQADSETVVAQLTAVMSEIQPDAVITFGPDGISGHPDHLAVHRLATAAFDRAAAHAAHAPHLYYIAPSAATEQGCGVPPPAEEVGGPVAFIDVGPYLVQKVRAAQQHQSQKPPFSGDPETEAANLACHELFRLARPRLSANGREPITDLLLVTNDERRTKNISR
jgi:N-acetylglucosamine malate deacetylase 2